MSTQSCTSTFQTLKVCESKAWTMTILKDYALNETFLQSDNRIASSMQRQRLSWTWLIQLRHSLKSSKSWVRTWTQFMRGWLQRLATSWIQMLWQITTSCDTKIWWSRCPGPLWSLLTRRLLSWHSKLWKRPSNESVWRYKSKNSCQWSLTHSEWLRKRWKDRVRKNLKSSQDQLL